MRVLLWKEMLEQWRSYRLLIVVAILLAAGILGPLTARYLNEILASLPDTPAGLEAILPKPDVAMSINELVDNLAQFGLILALLVPMAAVIGEKVSGTAAITLSKPVSRASFLFAKFLALAITFAAGLGLGVGAGYAYTGMLFVWLPPLGFVALAGLLLLYLLVYASLSLLASTLMRSQLAAAGLAVGTSILIGVLGTLPPLGRLLPGALINWGRGVAGSVPASAAWGAAAVSVAAILMTLLASWVVLRRTEI